MVDRPDWGALHNAFDGLRNAVGDLENTQREIMKITGTGWSDDRMIKAVVGPRGQLVDLDIDPRVYRKPNSKALSAAILAAVRVAVEDAMTQTREIIDKGVPGDLRIRSVGSLNVRRLIESHDKDLSREEGDDGGFVLREHR
jgi:DNA-binding protein YbaB